MISSKKHSSVVSSVTSARRVPSVASTCAAIAILSLLGTTAFLFLGNDFQPLRDGRTPSASSKRVRSHGRRNQYKKSPGSRDLKSSKSAKSSKDSGPDACTTTVVTSAVNGALEFTTMTLKGVLLENVDFSLAENSGSITTVDMTIPSTGIFTDVEVQAMAKSIVTEASTEVLHAQPAIVMDFSGISRTCSGSSMACHLTLPSRVTTVCADDGCMPTVCLLSMDSLLTGISTEDYSIAASNNELYFGDNRNCTIVKPDAWDEWIAFHFGNYYDDVDPELVYYDDPDGDGASNIVEYYGLSTRDPNVTDRRHLVAGSFPVYGTDPKNPDSDGDLIPDGYELFYGTDALVYTPIHQDPDGDGIDTFTELKYSTDPFAADSDGDGIPDGVEVGQGSNPNDDAESEPPEVGLIEIRLGVGDPSGSHSERYTMTVGPVVHQAPEFSIVNYETYTFPPGSHRVEVRHRDSIYSTPDYDYRAEITPLNLPNGVEFSIVDPEGLLGNHYESNYDYAAGKSATMIISGRLPPEDLEQCASPEIRRLRSLEGDPCPCASIDSCSTCRENPECEWERKGSYCRKWTNPRGKLRKPGPSTCACALCEEYFQEETAELQRMQQQHNTDWINELPRCPATLVRVSADRLRPSTCGTWSNAEGCSNVEWEADGACGEERSILFFRENCAFHPGADACYRANHEWMGETYRQQCCYRGDTLIVAPSDGAGTPDKETGLISHYLEDVIPHRNCCRYCERKEETCKLYQGGFDEAGNWIRGVRSDNRDPIP